MNRPRQVAGGPSPPPEWQQMSMAQVRDKAVAARESLNQLIAMLTTHPEQLTWPAVVQKFQVVNLELGTLMSSLNSSIMQQYIIHPTQVDAITAQVTPVQLSSKALPGMEAEQQQLTQQWNQNSDKSAHPQKLYTEYLQKKNSRKQMIMQALVKIEGSEYKAAAKVLISKASRELKTAIAAKQVQVTPIDSSMEQLMLPTQRQLPSSSGQQSKVTFLKAYVSGKA